MARSVLSVCFICTCLVSGHAVESGKCVAGSGPSCAGPDDTTLLQKLVAVHDDELNVTEEGEVKPRLQEVLDEDSDVESDVGEIFEKEEVGQDTTVEHDTRKSSWRPRRRGHSRRRVFKQYKFGCSVQHRKEIKACTFNADQCLYRGQSRAERNWQNLPRGYTARNPLCLGRRCEAMVESDYCSRNAADFALCQDRAKGCNTYSQWRGKHQSCGRSLKLQTRKWLYGQFPKITVVHGKAVVVNNPPKWYHLPPGQHYSCEFKATTDCYKVIMQCVDCVSKRCRYQCSESRRRKYKFENQPQRSTRRRTYWHTELPKASECSCQNGASYCRQPCVPTRYTPCRRGRALTEANTSHIEPFSSPTFETIPQEDGAQQKKAFTAHDSSEGKLAAEGDLASQATSIGNLAAEGSSGSPSLEEVKSGTMDEALTTKKTCR